jgi:hypothetical protein
VVPLLGFGLNDFTSDSLCMRQIPIGYGLKQALQLFDRWHNSNKNHIWLGKEYTRLRSDLKQNQWGRLTNEFCHQGVTRRPLGVLERRHRRNGRDGGGRGRLCFWAGIGGRFFV